MESADELTTLNHFSISSRFHELAPQTGRLVRQWGEGGGLDTPTLCESEHMDGNPGGPQTKQWKV